MSERSAPSPVAPPAALLAVAADAAERQSCARQLAAALGVPCAALGDDAFVLQLTLTAARLELRQLHPDAPGPIYADFSAAAARLRGRPTLLRAVGAGRRSMRVIDATAGLGSDALTLAAAGHEVCMVERIPVICALLADALARADGDHAARLRLVPGDARELLSRLGPADVVLLDPMYPLASGKQRRAKSLARKNKAMHLFRVLVGDDPDAPELLELARSVARHRVVVKRPRRAPPLPGPKPVGSVSGTTTRFDLYPPASAVPRG